LLVERDVNEPHGLEVVRQGARQRTDRVVTPVLVQLDRPDAHLEYMPCLCAPHRDRSREDVRAAELRLHAIVYRLEFRGHGQPGARLGRKPGAPDTVEMTTVSPELTVSCAGSLASKKPQCTVFGDASR